MSSESEHFNELVRNAEREEKELESLLEKVTLERLALEQQDLSNEEFQAKHNELTKLLTNYCCRFFAAKKKTADLKNQRDELARQGNEEAEKLREEIAKLQARCDMAENKLIADNSGAVINKKEEEERAQQQGDRNVNNTRSIIDNMYTPPSGRVHKGMTSFSQPGVTYSKMAKPPKFTSEGQDICIFLDRFEQYIQLSCHGNADNLELQLLSVIENDKMYRKLKGICASLYTHQKENITAFVAAIRKALFPATEARMMRASLNSMKQGPAESVEDFANRLMNEAEKAFSPSELTLREEACLATFIGGLREVSIKQKLMESDVGTFEQATQLARKQETIMHSLRGSDTERGEESWQELPVLRVGENVSGSQPNPPQLQQRERSGSDGRNGVVCWRCNMPNHVARNCRSGLPRNAEPQNERFNQPSNVTCYNCQQRGHFARNCPNRPPNAGRGRVPQENGRATNSLNENAAGIFPVHPSRQIL